MLPCALEKHGLPSGVQTIAVNDAVSAQQVGRRHAALPFHLQLKHFKKATLCRSEEEAAPRNAEHSRFPCPF
jgi:hypothetical protein